MIVSLNKSTMFKEKQFTIPPLKGISQKNIDEHIKLYLGYVKNSNLILEHIKSLSEGDVDYSYEVSELQRRFGFEFDGMRNHEYFFSSFEGGPISPSKESALFLLIEKQWGSFDTWLNTFKKLAMTRGVGWAILYYDPQSERLINAWIEEQHIGHLTGLMPILTLDMWEHAYVYDFPTSEKKNYVEAFFENINWKTIEDRLN